VPQEFVLTESSWAVQSASWYRTYFLPDDSRLRILVVQVIKSIYVNHMPSWSYFCDSRSFWTQIWGVCNLVIITTAIPLLHSFLAASDILNQSDTCAVPSEVLFVTPLGCSSQSLTQALLRLHLSSAAGDKGIENHSHVHLFSKVLHRLRRVSSRQHIYLLIAWSDYCVMRFSGFTYALHMCRQNLVPLSRLYTKISSLLQKSSSTTAQGLPVTQLMFANVLYGAAAVSVSMML